MNLRIKTWKYGSSILSLVAFVFCGFLSAEESKRSPDLEDLKRKISVTHMEMQDFMPKGFEAVPLDLEFPVAYDYAILSESRQIEIRYRIDSFQDEKKEMERIRNESPEAVLLPQGPELTASKVMAILMNLAGPSPRIYGSKKFPTNAVRTEFGAEWGTTTLMELGPRANTQYKVCSLTVLHKDGEGEAYVFFLARDLDTLLGFLRNNDVFYNLRYNRPLPPIQVQPPSERPPMTPQKPKERPIEI